MLERRGHMGYIAMRPLVPGKAQASDSEDSEADETFHAGPHPDFCRPPPARRTGPGASGPLSGCASRSPDGNHDTPDPVDAFGRFPSNPQGSPKLGGALRTEREKITRCQQWRGGQDSNLSASAGSAHTNAQREDFSRPVSASMDINALRAELPAARRRSHVDFGPNVFGRMPVDRSVRRSNSDRSSGFRAPGLWGNDPGGPSGPGYGSLPFEPRLSGQFAGPSLFAGPSAHGGAAGGHSRARGPLSPGGPMMYGGAHAMHRGDVGSSESDSSRSPSRGGRSRFSRLECGMSTSDGYTSSSGGESSSDREASPQGSCVRFACPCYK
jgi:hypothetical protein